MTAPATAEETVLLHAAGSLRGALTEVAKAFEAAGVGKVQAKFGPSGLLKDEIAAGAKAEVFASANMEHPQALASDKRSGPVVLFARNRLCALVRPGLEVTSASLLDRMLDPQVKLGTSTPKADPSGDYAWESSARPRRSSPAPTPRWRRRRCNSLAARPARPRRRAARSMAGSSRKAPPISSLPTAPMPQAAERENPAQQIVQLPDELSVGADYGLTVINGASVSAHKFALFILSVEGQRTLAKHGFAAPALPQ